MIVTRDTRHIELKQGDVFWVKSSDSSDSRGDYSHPHVIIQDDIINRTRIETVVMCALSSNMKRADEPGNILLDVDEANLPRRSIVVVSQIETINKTDLGEYIGTLSQSRVKQIFNGLRFQQKSYFVCNKTE